MGTDGYILVVDDDPEVRSYMELALEAVGRPVRTLSTAPGQITPPAVAFVDLLLGDDDGLELVRRLMADGVPVVAISGLAVDAPPVRAARAAGATVLPKPFTLSALRETARRLLDES